jgi:proteasome accessory factor B
MQRILTLDRWLRQGRRVVAKDAAAELGVDERTIRRDLKQVLAGEWKLPIKYDRAERVWFYEGDATSLPATIISSADRQALLLSLQAVEQFRGTPIHRQLKELYARLLELLMPESRTSYETLASKIRFEGPPLSPIASDVWNTLLNSLETNETVKITYKTGHSGETRRRSVDPYGLICRHREWYLVGWDHYRKDVRTFFLPRIAAIAYTDKTFRLRGGFDLDRYLSTAVDSHQSTGPVHHVVLRWSKESANLGQEFVWNETQKISHDFEGRVIVEFDTGALYAVERQVLGWGGKVEIVAPHELRRIIIARAEFLLSLHRNFA